MFTPDRRTLDFCVGWQNKRKRNPFKFQVCISNSCEGLGNITMETKSMPVTMETHLNQLGHYRLEAGRALTVRRTVNMVG